GGTVEKFIGDAVMAVWGTPVAHEDDAERAVRAALGIVDRLKGLNEILREQGIGPLEIGVGIHTGAVIAGLIGPDNRVEYGVVGDAVNLASRIESLTREMEATILVSSDVAAQLGPAFKLGCTASMPIKGKAQPVEVVEILSLCQQVDSSPAP
ncbi:MAG TPA: adenylate/guanylate cyclase domain-containing protein, partial [Steroidobacteraceae bacterium]|nr:adenylate/guanylate cyclase domain-containing protein [Steroidobacteraceae bacterium]